MRWAPEGRIFLSPAPTPSSTQTVAYECLIISAEMWAPNVVCVFPETSYRHAKGRNYFGRSRLCGPGTVRMRNPEAALKLHPLEIFSSGTLPRGMSHIAASSPGAELSNDALPMVVWCAMRRNRPTPPRMRNGAWSLRPGAAVATLGLAQARL